MMKTKPYRRKLPLSIFPVALSSFAIIAILYAERLRFLSSDSHPKARSCARKTAVVKARKIVENPDLDDRFEFDPEECDITRGKWVFNRSSKPLYTDRSCPYVERQYSCEKNGQLELDYRHWEWQPDDCYLPKFDPKVALKKLRGKRVVFVGDSLQRSQWESFICMVEWTIPPQHKSMKRGRIRDVFKAKEYNASIEFHWAPFLVQSNTDLNILEPKKRIVKIDSVSNSSRDWEGADIIAFNTYVWWMIGPRLKALSKDWGREDGLRCFNETKPLKNKNFWGSGADKEMMSVAAGVIGKMKVSVSVLNITQLSMYRVDAHSSIYTYSGGKLLADEENTDPGEHADCIHWCLPGVPDTWNQILFAHL
ncbi:hypothetical protein V6N13_005873 [Hibiscus sabdariffa]|uniref:Trichome birefringence-like N-terminal domain-containing protein n=1 Tax=Hibiscus sabdariffa TaxID=183260 RepID=A0ABR2EPG8_9ROSI